MTDRPLVFLILLAGLASAFVVDNNVEGEPEIECGPTSITVNFNTRNEFEGHVYVKGLYDDDKCRNDQRGRHVAGIELPFDTCNVARTRSLNPKGIFVSSTVVISFHPQFLTKVDRAYKIQCFYMEADKTVSADLEVPNEMTTLFQTQIVPMPVCQYQILDGGPTGAPLHLATLGQTVYHKWSCASETVDTFCMVVHSCTVDDGNGDRIQILDQDGCALDKFILDNLEYPEDMSAGQMTMVYKYADRSQLFYQCQVSIIIKDPHEECPRPQCAEPIGFGAKQEHIPKESRKLVPASRRVLRKRRDVNMNTTIDYEHTMDVRYELTAIEIAEDQNLPSSMAASISSTPICVSSNIAVSIIAFFFAVLLTVIALIMILSRSAGDGKSFKA
ncbi:hypothetical protein PMAYCL1PPCAC_04479 [Pristionchus mayeri]|uniref:ZP domain-containing protein n=1 Tax=Pristionchus mayeri TaxID=1317129 RepID=A0AAN4Z6L7_9BILA|nr:hypothetical protein PMAYCL1PPCAC_04479 [Pristionchus mayeri]